MIGFLIHTQPVPVTGGPVNLINLQVAQVNLNY